MILDEKKQVKHEFLNNLAFDGWNQAALEKAVESLGKEKIYAEILFPGGIKEFTKFFADECNEKLEERAKDILATEMRLSEKVEEIIFEKIKIYHDEIGSLSGVQKFSGYCACPNNLTFTMQNIYEFSSEVWYMLKDKSTDFSYYTKRISLGTIYSNCFLYSISDDSENLEKTRAYIKRNIDGLMKFNKLKQKFKNLTPSSKFEFKNKSA